IDYKKFTFAHRFYLEIVAFNQLLENPVNQICGGTFIFDYEGMGIRGFLEFTPFWMRMLVESLLNAFPCRLKSVHLVNTPSFFPLIMKLVNPFLLKKIQNRVFFHSKSDWENLHALISPNILPEKYGGKLKQNELIDALKNLKEQEEKFLQLFAFGNIETKNARQSLKVFE
ncbi:Alpha-tocopherol transfer protein-like, partial [Araneus ventricosus]